ncbi:hypothetical protein ISP15_01340 [Dyella jejuensis]|uniref:Uncharacterized protein n=1 Tax=Dyella jejuensis TaxID=1432009 RepID=A0ABW8JD52_9GAMM
MALAGANHASLATMRRLHAGPGQLEDFHFGRAVPDHAGQGLAGLLARGQRGGWRHSPWHRNLPKRRRLVWNRFDFPILAG